MKILLLTDGLRAGGKERRLVELIKGFETYSDIDLHLVVFSEEIHYQEVYKLGVPVSILKRVPKRNPKVFYRLFKLCKSWKPDLVHSWGTMSTIFAIPASVVLKIKIINGNIANAPNNFGFFDQRRLHARLTFPFSKVVVGNSLAGLKVYGVPKKKAVCVYNGFDNKRTTNLKDKMVVREQFKISTERVIGMVGSFYGKKDYRTYIEAALILFRKREDVTFLAVGGGTELGMHKEMIPAEYASKFIFTGLQKDVESIVNIFDIGVLSTYTEGISNAILEYMALGKPTVATSGGGTSEVVDDMKTGFLIPPFSPAVMADKIHYLLENLAIRQEMGSAGKNRLESIFNLEQMTKTFYEMYVKVLSGE